MIVTAKHIVEIIRALLIHEYDEIVSVRADTVDPNSAMVSGWQLTEDGWKLTDYRVKQFEAANGQDALDALRNGFDRGIYAQ